MHESLRRLIGGKALISLLPKLPEVGVEVVDVLQAQQNALVEQRLLLYEDAVLRVLLDVRNIVDVDRNDLLGLALDFDHFPSAQLDSQQNQHVPLRGATQYLGLVLKTCLVWVHQSLFLQLVFPLECARFLLQDLDLLHELFLDRVELVIVFHFLLEVLLNFPQKLVLFEKGLLQLQIHLCVHSNFPQEGLDLLVLGVDDFVELLDIDHLFLGNGLMFALQLFLRLLHEEILGLLHFPLLLLELQLQFLVLQLEVFLGSLELLALLHELRFNLDLGVVLRLQFLELRFQILVLLLLLEHFLGNVRW